MQNVALKILRSISEVIATNDHIGSVLSEIVEILAGNLHVDVCSIYVYQEDFDKLTLVATSGLNKSSVGNISLKPGVGITGTAFTDGEVINVASAKNNPNYQFFKNLGEEKYNSFLSSPLIIGSKKVGVLNLQRIVEEEFDDTVVDMVKTLSTQIANLVLSAQMLSVLSSSDNDTQIMTSEQKVQTRLQGVSMSSDIVKGNAVIYLPNDNFNSVEPTTELSLNDEVELFYKAIKRAKIETVDLEETAISMISEADASIFDVHLMFLDDLSLIKSMKEIILRGYSAEYAIKHINALYQNRFRKMSEEIFREKGADLKDVMLRLFNHVKVLKKQRDENDNHLEVSDHHIIIVKELLPSDIFKLNSNKLLGIVTEKGSNSSHIAILAKALNVPIVLGVKGLMLNVQSGDPLILDCNTAACYICPNEDIISSYKDIISAKVIKAASLEGWPAVTADGQLINMRGNISLISETPLLKQFGAKGIGLYRTEFLYMIRDYLPSEDVQFKVFSSIMKGAEGNEVTFRLLDIGGDKTLSYLKFPEDSNPAFGERGIRLLLKRHDILRPHLRAILRASRLGTIKILCPMVSGVAEIIAIKKIINESINVLENKGYKDKINYKLGIMLEVPSALFQLDEIIEHISFVSIGSNDLFQYIFASDRDENNSTAPDYMEPAFLKMIAKAAKIVNSSGEKEISICGEMAGDPLIFPLLAGAGIFDLSMQPSKIPAVQKQISRFTIPQCEQLLAKAIRMRDANGVLLMLQNS